MLTQKENDRIVELMKKASDRTITYEENKELRALQQKRQFYVILNKKHFNSWH